ncbi:glycerophosphoryl diester phosphodiesterase membrane domain-containing protein [Microbacterium trichothecenolyticum]|uniref:glycerophosphoryl diester phosphodiesterase membrane domain-containing protein n=1 Tax=Microbacterium trichothecenolyticum TaxID=69370 RepID=UPI001C6EF149|nr:glycerophosphoryl diester phosphodiesterase membrane domain-containing protein [Microbacterium trichothecenolyticum]
MSAYPAWTPASRPGIIPLHPLSFGTILGRSFAALRQNPRVLLGFALVVQTLAYIVVLAGVLAVGWASFSRLDTLQPGTEEYDTVMAGSIALTAVAGIVLSLAAGALSVIVQGIVVVEVTHAALAEKLTLGALWRQVKPIAWRLIGYSLLVILAIVALVAVVVLAIVGIAIAAPPAAIALTIMVILASIPITWWLMIKLLLVPAAIIVEHATILQALSRSWTLTRGRFWPALGIIIVISVIFAAVAQVVSLPMSFLSMGLTTIIAPTGDPEPTAIIGFLAATLLTQVLTLLLQSVAVVVQSTATALIYIDCRMRREGLDLDLLAYVERRDAGATALADPYREHIGREISPRGVPAAYPVPGYAPYAPGSATPGYPPAPAGAVFSTQPQPGYGPPAGYAPQTGYAAPPAYGPPPGYGAPAQPAYATPAQPGYGSQPPAHGAPAPAAAATAPAQPPAGPAADPATPPPAPAHEQSPTRWIAPGAAPDGTDRESPWA